MRQGRSALPLVCWLTDVLGIVEPPLQNLFGEAFLFLGNPKLSLTSLPLGLKESFGRLVTELGRSRATHQPKATKGRRRGPPCGKDGRASGAQPKDGPPAGIARKEPPKERSRGGQRRNGGAGPTQTAPATKAAEPPRGEGQQAALRRSQRKILRMIFVYVGCALAIEPAL